jgi:hypothetical protein
MRRDLEPLPARLARHIVVDAHQVILDLVEERAVARVGAGRHACLLRPPHPSDRILVGAPAPRALKACRALFGFFGEELSLVHGRSVHEKARRS